MKKVLIILYYWPPAGGAGVQRWLKFVKYLRNFGWEPIVFAPENPDYPLVDASREKEIPEGIKVIKFPIWEPFSLYKKFTGKKEEDKMDFGHLVNAKSYKQKGWKERAALWVRGNLFIPDARCFWIRPSVRFLYQYLKENPVDAMVSSGPPQSAHLIAMGLKDALNIPWIADFRDPWGEYFNELSLSNWARKQHETLERNVLQKSDKVVVVGKKMQIDNEKFAGVKSEIVMNGFDFEDYQSGSEVTIDENIFTISYVGTLSQRRNNSTFWKVIAKLRADNEAFRNKFIVQLIGKIDSSVSEDIAKYKLQDAVKIVNYMPFSEVIAEQQKSTALLLLVDNFEGSSWVLTGKFFEYLAANRPILAIGPTDGDLAKEMNDTKCGIITNYEDEIGLEKAVLSLFERFLKGELKQHKNEHIEKFSRLALTKRMAEILTEISTK
jgi:glycosyltransferase involved in cell wall biosynthesis